MPILLLSGIVENAPSLKPFIEKIEKAKTLSSLVLATLWLARALAVLVIESELNRRAKLPTSWPKCPVCGRKQESRGFLDRSILTLIGMISWKRRVGRCPTKGCSGRQSAPFDEVLGIAPYQQTSNELKQVSCALAVFVPFEIAANLLERISGVWVSPASVWRWVQRAGQGAMDHLARQIEKLAQGQEPSPEDLEDALAALPLMMGADGVMAPFRPNGGSPAGKTQWREVKVGIFARLGKKINRVGKEVTVLKHRRVTAVLGCSQMLAMRMVLSAIFQGVRTAKSVAWLSDGGPWLWNIFKEHFAPYATGILDFYHAAQNIWKGASACLGGTTEEAGVWFAKARHKLRHGKPIDLLRDIQEAMNLDGLSQAGREALTNLYDYLEKHLEHIDYTRFKELGLPIGSGMVESACKWLIQQRFKGVGMRWSEEGFNHLLHLRLAWVNSTFDDLFPDCVYSPNP